MRPRRPFARMMRRFCAEVEQPQKKVIVVRIPLVIMGVLGLGYCCKQMYIQNYFGEQRFFPTTFDERLTFLTPDSRKLTWLQLVRWLKRNGAELHPGVRLGIGRDADEGVFATQDIPKDTILCRIPEHLRIGPQILERTELVQDLVWSNSRLNGNLGGMYGAPFDVLGIALFLADQSLKGRESPWWPYIESLPQDFMAPYLALDYQIVAHNFSLWTTRQFKKQRQHVSKSFRYGMQFAPDVFEKIDAAKWCHFWSLAQARGSMVQTFGENANELFRARGGTSFMNPFKSELVPFVDMMKHSESPTAEWIPKSHIVVSTKDIKKGDEICMNYHQNWRNTDPKLFLIYGLPPVKPLGLPKGPAPEVFIKRYSREQEDQIDDDARIQDMVAANKEKSP